MLNQFRTGNLSKTHHPIIFFLNYGKISMCGAAVAQQVEQVD